MRETWGSWHLLYVESRGDLFSRAVRSTMAVSGLWRSSTMAFAALWIKVFVHRVSQQKPCLFFVILQNMTRTFLRIYLLSFYSIHPINAGDSCFINPYPQEQHYGTSPYSYVGYVYLPCVIATAVPQCDIYRVNCNFNVSKKTNSGHVWKLHRTEYDYLPVLEYSIDTYASNEMDPRWSSSWWLIWKSSSKDPKYR